MTPANNRSDLECLARAFIPAVNDTQNTKEITRQASGEELRVRPQPAKPRISRNSKVAAVFAVSPKFGSLETREVQNGLRFPRDVFLDIYGVLTRFR